MKQLSIILPVYNEKDTIQHVLEEWKRMLSPFHISYIFIICEDGSTDGTKGLLKKLTKKFPLLLNQKRHRRGYGGAVIDGIKSAKTPYILCIDSDGQCSPKDFKKFWKKKDTADVIIGWRTKRADAQQRKIFSKAFKTAFLFLFPTPIHDPSAPFVLFKKKTIISYLSYLQYLKEGFWWGFIGMCVKKDLPIIEIPITHRKRYNGDTQVYHIKKIPSIAIRNFLGLIRLKFSR